MQSHKNDWRDAEALGEAVGRPTLRSVPVKTVAPQSVQPRHRARALAVSQRTALAHQLRGLLFEYGLVVAQGVGTVLRRVPELVEEADNGVPRAIREVLVTEREELVHLDERVKRFAAQLDAFAREDAACRRLQTIPGVGPQGASALVAAAGDAKTCGSGREFAAWRGLTPRQRSTGGCTVLGGISKRGDRPRRALLMHGARAALRGAPRREDRRSRWAVAVHARRGAHSAAVALAHKTARTAWALRRREHEYHVLPARAPASGAEAAKGAIPGGSEVANSGEGDVKSMAKQVGPAGHEPEPALGPFEAVEEMRRGVRGFHQGPGTTVPTPEAGYKCATEPACPYHLPLAKAGRTIQGRASSPHSSRRQEPYATAS